MDPRSSSIKLLRRVGLYEGISFLVLLGIAMPLKYAADMPMAVKVVGWAHGVLFMLFLFALWQAQRAWKWDLEKTAWSFMASILPFGTFVVDARIWRKEEASLA